MRVYNRVLYVYQKRLECVGSLLDIEVILSLTVSRCEPFQTYAYRHSDIDFPPEQWLVLTVVLDLLF